jgi:hypothetical protein
VGFTLLNITITIYFIITLIQQFVMVFYSALTMTGNWKYLYLTALNTALCLTPSSDWSLPAYLSRSDPTALGTLKRFPISGSSVLGTGFSSGSGSGGWKEVGSHPPPARSSGSKHRPVLSIQSSPGLIINSSSEADMSGLAVKKVDVVEVLVKKCLHLIGYVEGAGAMTSSTPHQSLPAGPPGFNSGNGSGVGAYTATSHSGHSGSGSGVAGGGFIRVGGMWNGDGQNSAVCLATIHSLGILTVV